VENINEKVGVDLNNSCGEHQGNLGLANKPNSTKSKEGMDMGHEQPNLIVVEEQHVDNEVDKTNSLVSLSIEGEIQRRSTEDIHCSDLVPHKQNDNVSNLFSIPQGGEDNVKAAEDNQSSMPIEFNAKSKAPSLEIQRTDRRARRRRVIPKMKDLARARAMKMKRKSKKNVKAVNSRPEGAEVSKISNQVNVSFDSSISNDVSEWRKWVLLHEGADVVAKEV
jgi:hypothetical protein